MRRWIFTRSWERLLLKVSFLFFLLYRYPKMYQVYNMSFSFSETPKNIPVYYNMPFITRIFHFQGYAKLLPGIYWIIGYQTDRLYEISGRSSIQTRRQSAVRGCRYTYSTDTEHVLFWEICNRAYNRCSTGKIACVLICEWLYWLPSKTVKIRKKCCSWY